MRPRLGRHPESVARSPRSEEPLGLRATSGRRRSGLLHWIGPRLLLVLGLLGPTAAWPAESSKLGDPVVEGEGEQGFSFLMKKAELMFEFGKLGDASRALEAACRLPEGREDFDCWRKLGTVSESAGRIGVAIDAWATAAAFGGREEEVAKAELRRLQSIYGRISVLLGRGRSLPSLPFKLMFEGLLIDPALKTYVQLVQQKIAAFGLKEAELWMPEGTVRVGQSEVEVIAGVTVEWLLPDALAPARPKAFRLGATGDLGPVAGPWSFAVALEGALGGVPGGLVGRGPVSGVIRLALARRVGPVRLEGRLRTGLTLTASEGGTAEADEAQANPDDRAIPSLQVLGQLDLGLDLAFGPRFFGTPHVGIVGGSLGEGLVGCLAEHKVTGVVYEGQCRLSTVGIGAQAGIDLWWLISPRGRWALQLGVVGEVLGGGITVPMGAELAGDGELSILQVQRSHFVWLRLGVDFGLVLRF